MKKLLLIICILCISGNAYADATVNSAGCTTAEINTALATASASSGIVTVNIPACASTKHTERIRINMSTGYANVTTLNILGAGIGVTTLTNSGWEVTCSAAKKFRMAYMTLDGTSVDVGYGGMIQIFGPTSSSTGGGFIFDHMNMDTPAYNRLIYIFDHAYGVIHSNIIKSGDMAFAIRGNTGSTTYGGNVDWSDDDDFGSADAVYIENNTFTSYLTRYPENGSLGNNYFIADGDGGAKTVIRFNTATNFHIGQHDATVGNRRSNRSWEYYNNYINNSCSWCLETLNLRGGTGYAYNNRTNATYSQNPYGHSAMVYFRNMRDSTTYGAPWNNLCDTTAEKICVSGTYPKACSTDADCAGVSGACQFTDDQGGDGKDYPCRDQIGRGKDQGLRPTVVWNNKTILPNATETWATVSTSAKIVANRDFYISTGTAQTSATSPFDGTTGAGYGLVANRPTTCTTGAESGGGVAYFATDENKLYRCTATDTWAEEYTPYTCPHPLTGYAEGCTYTEYGTTGYNTGEDTTAPTCTFAVDSTGLIATGTCSESVDAVTKTGLSFTGSVTGAITATYKDGMPGANPRFDLGSEVQQSDVVTADYTTPGTGIKDAAGNALANFSGASVFNGSTQNTPPTYAVTINKTGTGCTITSLPSGANCGETCSVTVDSGTVVTLGGYLENGWASITYGGDCASNGTVTVNADKTCTVTCTPVYLLN